jgi:hypothetical protein
MTPAERLRERVRERLQEQRALVRSLLSLRDQLQGSLFVRYGQCGKTSCVCHTGRRHGPYYVLSNRSGGQGAFAYLDAERATRARELVARYRSYRRGLARLQRINLELVALLRQYQSAQLRRTGRRLGVTSATRT